MTADTWVYDGSKHSSTIMVEATQGNAEGCATQPRGQVSQITEGCKTRAYHDLIENFVVDAPLCPPPQRLRQETQAARKDKRGHGSSIEKITIPSCQAFWLTDYHHQERHA